jgi:hypothetical protein
MPAKAASAAATTAPAEPLAPELVQDAPETTAPILPNLKGKVLKENIKTIGTGRYAAEYCPWSRISELLNESAPGWFPEMLLAPDGSHTWRAPVGGYLMIRFSHLDGTKTEAFPQAIMDNRHASIPYDKITSRDISDTQRRGFCLVAAAVFSLGVELWTRDECEAGFSRVLEEGEETASGEEGAAAPKAARAPKPTEEQFLEAALAKGLTTYAAQELSKKLKGNFASGIATLAKKDLAWVDEYNKATAPKTQGEETDGSQW